MSTCAAILATIVALVVILIAYLWVKVTSARRKAKAALKGWAAIHSPAGLRRAPLRPGAAP